MEVNNHDIVGSVRRIDRFCEELHKSVSSSGSELNPFDLKRTKSYLDAADSYIEWVTGEPQLDLPESSPKNYQLPEPPEMGEVENEAVNDCLRLMFVLRDGLTNSQSARDAAGLKPFDKGRVKSVIEKVRSLLEKHVEPMGALDLPESSPATPNSGPGKRGV